MAKLAQRKFDEGYILIAVLWIAGLLAAMVIAIVFGLRNYRLQSSNINQMTYAESVANGFTTLLSYKLSTTAQPMTKFKLNGDISRCRWSGQAVITSAIQDQGGLIDINTASLDLLDNFFQERGLSSEQAQTLITQLQDYRDGDDTSISGGSESDAYTRKARGPKNSPFTDVDEIDQLPLINEAVREKIMPFITVYSQLPGIDFSVAPENLMKLLSDVPNFKQKFSASSEHKVFKITTTVSLASGTIYTRQAVVAIVQQPDMPYKLLAWKKGGLNLPVPPANTAMISCFSE